MNMPRIIHKSLIENGIKLQLDIDHQLSAFEGHFDDAPIVPGVVQIQWALAFNNQFLQEISPLNIFRMDALKFQQVIQPDSVVELMLERISNKLVFSFSSGSSRHSSGKIVVE